MSEETNKMAPAGDPEPDKGIPVKGVQPRGKWANKAEFLLCVAGLITGLRSIWRFPFLCFYNGGGIFLIPYIVLLLICGIPIFFLEMAVGQYTSEGGVTAWRKICPMFQGVGVASQVIVFYLNTYYIVILAWALFYLFNSFKNPLPWSTCDNWWNTESCHAVLANSHLFRPDSDWSFLNNSTTTNYSDDLTYMNFTDHFLNKSPEEEFWNHRVLRMSADMSLTSVHKHLAPCLLLAWIMCYLCTFKGIKWMGKVVYFTATFPFLALFIILIRGLTLPGAMEGIKYFFHPDISKLIHVDVWCHAALEVFSTCAICMGVLTTLGSYNKYNNDCYRDCWILCGLSTAANLFSGIVVFSFLGFMAHIEGSHINDVATAGTNLVFIAFPRVLSVLPASSFWAVLFFLMVLCLGLHSQFVLVESLATSLIDLLPQRLKRLQTREVMVLIIAAVCFLLGLPFLTEGGIVLFYMIDTYGPSGITFLIIACCETVVIAWVYGADRFYDNIKDMLGYPPFPVLKYCWLFITPLTCGIVLLYSLTKSYPFIVYDYVPGTWTKLVNCLFFITPLMCIPAFILVSLYKNGQNMTTPSSDLRQTRPHKPILTLCKSVIFKAQGQPNRRMEEGNEKIVMEEAGGV